MVLFLSLLSLLSIPCHPLLECASTSQLLSLQKSYRQRTVDALDQLQLQLLMDANDEEAFSVIPRFLQVLSIKNVYLTTRYLRPRVAVLMSTDYRDKILHASNADSHN